MRTLKLGNPSEFHVGSDSYHQYKQDVQVLKDIGASYTKTLIKYGIILSISQCKKRYFFS